MLKKSASGVLASLRDSTYHRERAVITARGGRVRKGYASPRHWALTGSRPSADVTLLIRRVADLAAALLDSLFEHPGVILALAPYGTFQPYSWHHLSFSCSLAETL
jgi:hypothetical protein